MGNIIAVDVTIFIQLANFLITVVVLNFLLIKPVRKQIASRREFALAHTDAIDAFTSDADTKIAAYESALAEARGTAAAAREQLKSEGHAKEQEILGAAQTDAQAFLRSSREEVSRETKAAMKTLTGQIDGFAAKAASKIFN